MPKRICAKVDTYEKDGQTKGKYIDIGVILPGQHGEYVLLDPTVNLAGVLMKQRLMDPKKGGKAVICSIFDNDNKGEQQGGGKAPAEAEFNDDIPF